MNFSKLYFQCLGLAAACPSGNIVLQESGDDVAKIVLNRSIRDVDENVGRGVQETLIVDNSRASLKLLSSSPSVSKAAAQSLSPSGAKEVSFVNTKSPSGGDPCPMVEIINHSSDEVYGNVKVDLSTVHGAVVGDTWFWVVVVSRRSFRGVCCKIIGSEKNDGGRKCIVFDHNGKWWSIF
jgi:hypothetical protein